MTLSTMPNFIIGASKALDLGNTLDLCNDLYGGEMTNQRALLSDWQQVGIDINNAMGRFEYAEEPTK